VGRENKSKAEDILPVPRTREEARQAYDVLSRFYDYTLGFLRRKHVEMALQRLSIVEGETILEIGFGTGDCLKRIAQLVGQTGKAYGVDISRGMIERTKKRLEKAGLAGRVALCCGDATYLPFHDGTFDTVFASFTLEVLDTPDIARVLAQIKRVLKPGGRLGIVDMSKQNGMSLLLKGYEWLHKKCPKYLGSRPIYAEQCLREAGYQTKNKENVRIHGLPAEIIVANDIGPGDSIQRCRPPAGV
jgi:demethylmenaquinone methyltransferase/2-methoxy-6-polyprenyl-1,4-benzoquinol methylase